MGGTKAVPQIDFTKPPPGEWQDYVPPKTAKTDGGWQDYKPQIDFTQPPPAPKPEPSKLSTNEMLLTSLGGPWANDPRLSTQDKSDLATGRAAGYLSGMATVPAVIGGTAAGVSAPAIARGVVQGAKAVLPAAGPTLEETAKNVTKWAIEAGIKGGGMGGAWWLLHHLLGGEKGE